MDKKKFEKRLKKYCEIVGKLNREYYKRNGFKEEVVGSISITTEAGHRFVKVLVGGRIHTFIDSEKGDILKAATYKAVAKNGVRGSILSKDYGESVITEFGAKYLR